MRSLARTLLMAEVPAPLDSQLTPDEAWALVRQRVLEFAVRSTEAATATWAASLWPQSAVEQPVGGAATAAPERFSKPRGLSGPGSHTMLVVEGKPERAKCLYLAVAAALELDPGELVRAMRAEAREFLAAVPMPSAGDMVPEPLLYAFELAHDLLRQLKNPEDEKNVVQKAIVS